MINVSEAAQKQLESYFADKEKAPVRVYLASGG
jgi:Fe-S cluster assembly iron-binding protein IscA